MNKWFRATVNEEEVYFHVVTWYMARDIARRLWPLEVFEECWRLMTEVDGPPPAGSQAYEWDYEFRMPMQAEGYEFDTVLAFKLSPKKETVAPRKKAAKKAGTRKKASKKRKLVKASRK